MQKKRYIANKQSSWVYAGKQMASAKILRYYVKWAEIVGQSTQSGK